MADIKISDMALSTVFTGDDYFPFIGNGSNKRITAASLFSNIQDPVIVNYGFEDNDLTVRGTVDPNLFFVDASTNRVGVSTNAPMATLDVDGNIAINGPVYNQSLDVQSSSGVVSLSTGTTISDSTNPMAFQLGTGTPGQYKSIFRKGSGSLVLNFSGASLVGGASITFSGVGSSAKLQYINSNWYVVSAFNTVIA